MERSRAGERSERARCQRDAACLAVAVEDALYNVRDKRVEPVPGDNQRSVVAGVLARLRGVPFSCLSTALDRFAEKELSHTGRTNMVG